MVRAGRKTKEMKHVGFRTPLDLYRDYVMVAESRGIDLSALFNWVLSEFRPVLLLQHAQYQASMLHAAIVDPHQEVPEGVGKTDSLAVLNDLIRQMQDLASVLHEQSCKGTGRLAA